MNFNKSNSTKSMIKSISFILILLVFAINAKADIRLPAIIGDHMVMQQSGEVKLWGWCEPNEPIEVKPGWDTVTYKAVGTSGATWSVTVKTPVAGGPYKINLKGYNSIVIDDVLIGEVWLCSGQSNMEMSVYWGLPYNDEAAQATNKSIRFFHIPKATAITPQNDLKGRWVVSNPNDMKGFSAVAYFFGKKLQDDLKYPVGLIHASWGGTPAEVWTPENTINQDSILKAAAQKLNPSNGWPITPGYTYNAMIAPLTNYAIAGAIWYQGESNTGTANTYSLLLSSMIDSWRKKWQKDFPFYYVQIAPFAYGNNNIGPLLREAQTKVLATPKTGMVVTSDLVDNIYDIHPKMKKEVGLRLANYALVETYGKAGIGFKSPSYKSMKIEKNKVVIYLNNAEKGLMIKGDKPIDFLIAGEDKTFYPADVKIKGNTVVVSSKEVKTPVAVRFGFSNIAMPNLYSKDGLPVNLFRTDDWEVDTSEVPKK